MKHLYLLVMALMIIGFMSLTLFGPSDKIYADLAVRCGGSYSFRCSGPSNYPTDQCSVLAHCLTGSQFTAWQLYVLNLGIESVVAAGFVLVLKKSKRLILAVMAVNLVSWPVLYNSVSHFQTIGFLVLAEIAVWLFETVGIYLLCYKQITAKQALVLSTMTNASSILASFLLIR